MSRSTGANSTSPTWSSTLWTNAVHTRHALISGIRGYGHFGDGRTVDVHVARLRRKLGPVHRDRTSPVRRVGYEYVPDHR
ncbi:winged helix-turn-helix domain-containing protein [Streptomyces sp. NPDC059072]|uniref:winged helix-turn-helix domain-containing protein n=1 Tax=Streptomyces sp. NPDC059072 TaxID=3346715 RepID=UPI0036CCC887